MTEGQHSRYAALAKCRRARKAKRRALLVSLALVCLMSVGGTLAWLTAQTDEVVNIFTPGDTVPKVEEGSDGESFDGVTKSNVKVRNEGNVLSYIRADVVIVWSKIGDSNVVMPVEEGDYKIVFANDGWVQGGDGIWYYTSPVDSGDATGVLVTSCTQSVQKEGWQLRVDILASSIQAVPETAVEQAWDVEINSGVLVPKATISDAE